MGWIESIGLELNYTKSVLLINGDDAVPEEWSAKNGKVSRDFVRLLGSPIGPDKDACAEYCLNQSMQSEKFFQLLTHEAMPVSLAYALLRVCGHPRLNYLIRSTPPEITKQACEHFDGLIQDCLSKLLKVGAERIAIASGKSVEKKVVIVMGVMPEEIETRLFG